MNDAVKKIEALLESMMTQNELLKSKKRSMSAGRASTGGEYQKPVGKDYKAGKYGKTKTRSKYPPSRI